MTAKNVSKYMESFPHIRDEMDAKIPSHLGWNVNLCKAIQKYPEERMEKRSYSSFAVKLQTCEWPIFEGKQMGPRVVDAIARILLSEGFREKVLLVVACGNLAEFVELNAKINKAIKNRWVTSIITDCGNFGDDPMSGVFVTDVNSKCLPVSSISMVNGFAPIAGESFDAVLGVGVYEHLRYLRPFLNAQFGSERRGSVPVIWLVPQELRGELAGQVGRCIFGKPIRIQSLPRRVMRLQTAEMVQEGKEPSPKVANLCVQMVANPEKTLRLADPTYEERMSLACLSTLIRTHLSDDTIDTDIRRVLIVVDNEEFVSLRRRLTLEFDLKTIIGLEVKEEQRHAISKSFLKDLSEDMKIILTNGRLLLERVTAVFVLGVPEGDMDPEKTLASYARYTVPNQASKACP